MTSRNGSSPRQKGKLPSLLARAAGVVEEALKLAPMKAELRSVLARYKAEAQAIAP